MKKYINIFKDLISNKRTRAIMILALYFIFFIVVISIFNGKREDNIIVTEIPFQNLTNYSYSLIVNDTDNYTVVSYAGELTGIPDDLKFLNNKFIYELETSATLLKSNTDYSTEITTKEYSVSSITFEILLNTKNTAKLYISYKNDKIQKVIIEFEKEYKTFNKLELNYMW